MPGLARDPLFQPAGNTISPILCSEARPGIFRRAPILWYNWGDLPFTIHHPSFKAKAHSITALWAEREVKSDWGTSDQTNEHKVDGGLIRPPPGSDSYGTFYQQRVCIRQHMGGHMVKRPSESGALGNGPGAESDRKDAFIEGAPKTKYKTTMPNKPGWRTSDVNVSAW